MKSVLKKRDLNSLSNGFQQPTVAGKIQGLFMKSIEMINLEREEKVASIKFKVDLAGQMD